MTLLLLTPARAPRRAPRLPRGVGALYDTIVAYLMITIFFVCVACGVFKR